MTLATGGTETLITVSGVDYQVHTFTSSGILSVTTGGDIEYLVVAGGGGGGAGNNNEGGGGGGAGGYRTGTFTTVGGTYPIVIGGGGGGTTDTSTNGGQGGDSSAFEITSLGGGSGGSCSPDSGGNGGSGGGGGGCGAGKPGGSGTAGQGNNGGRGQWTGDASNPDNGNNGNGGGGGGAGSAGQSGFIRGGFSTGTGTIGGAGSGTTNSITGTSIEYARGGDGGAGRSSHTGANGTENRGQGGGGSANGQLSGNGGSGVVIIRYQIETIVEPELGSGGVGGPYAGGGGGAGGYIPFVPPVEVNDTQDILQNRDVIAITANGINTGQNNTFLDSSTNNFTITRNGNATQGTFTPYSPAGWSGHLPASTTITVNSGSVFNFGTADFTFEAWVFPTNTTNSQIIDARPGSTNGAYFTCAIGPSVGSFYTNSNERIVGTIFTPVGQWSHFAITRTAGTTRMFVNGAQSGSNFSDSTNYISSSAPQINWNAFIGASAASLYISSMRVIKGTSLYSSAFTPPTAKLQAVAGTALLILQENIFRDQSSNNISVTKGATVAVMPFSPFAPTALYNAATHSGSAYFDGTGDYLSVPANSAFAFGTSDYTIEFYLYPNSTADFTIVDSQGSGGNAQISRIGGALYHGGVDVWNYTVINNVWTHIAFSRSGTSLRLFANGVLIETKTNSNTVGSSTNVFEIGRRIDGFYPFNGYISNLRVVKGTAVYTTAFTPPTAPVTAVTNTSLLLNSTNAAIADVSGKNNIETLNGAQVSTSIAKHGSGSMFFDGVDDHLLIANNPNLILAGGPWTAECWIYPTGNYSAYRTIFSKRASGSATTSYQGYLRQTSGVISFFNGTEYNSTTTPPANQWSHCAWVYTGTNIQIYLNGVSVLNTAVTVTEVNAPVTIGGLQGAAEPFAGYIDDFRITKGVTRYTAAFTPPDEIYLPPPEIVEQLQGSGADGSALQAGEDNSLGGGAGGGSSETVAGGGGGVGINGLIAGEIDLTDAATGGVKSSYINPSNIEYVVHTFTSSGSLVCATSISTVEYLVIAGGGGASGSFGGGGGAGGYRSSVVGEQSGGNSNAESTLQLSAETYSVIVGAGGAAGNAALADPRGTNGSNSSFSSITSLGGGTSGSYKSFTTFSLGIAGGSGGGGGSSETSAQYAGGAGTAGQGFAGGQGWGRNGYLGGGGGGAGAVGQDAIASTKAGNGGTGISSLINGTSTIRAGGGGGAAYNYANSTTDGTGGAGGGGAGRSNVDSATGISGTANTGGGGGGGGYISGVGGSGGSGIVIIRYPRFNFGPLLFSTGGAVDQGGEGGSGGLPGVNGNGGLYGGGGGGTANSTVNPLVGNGAGGALKIVWPATRQYPSPNQFASSVTNLIGGVLQSVILAIDTPEQEIPMITATVPIKESLTWVNNLSNTYQIGTSVAYDTKFPVSSPRPVPESPYVSTKELQILVTEIDHELMLVNDDPKELATWNDPTKYQRIDRVTLENDPRRITVRLLNYVVGVTGEGALVPTQIQTWF